MHVSVLPAEVLAHLAPQPGQTVVDATAGAGGHARLIAERLGPTGRLIVLDRDAGMLEIAKARLEGVACRVNAMHANFDALRDVLDELEITAADGVLADLGICSDQLDQADRGFSFQQPGPLDMRMDTSSGESAADLVNGLSERDLADLIFRYGEERCSRRIARRIVEARKAAPLETTETLAALVRRTVPRAKGRHPIDPATRTFQALRIAVNDELGSLERLLEALPKSVSLGGRAVIISFHSLEDRLVKRAFRDKEQWDVITRKPVQAGENEVRDNPRSRSAKLRAAIRQAAGSSRKAKWPAADRKTLQAEEE